MTSAVIIFLLVGLGHSTSHILMCSDCRRTVMTTSLFFVETMGRMLGWPIFLWIQAHKYTMGRIEMRQAVQEGRLGQQFTLAVEPENGETMEEAINRAVKQADEIMRKASK